MTEQNNICKVCGKLFPCSFSRQICPECMELYGLGEENKPRGTPHIQWEAAEQEALFKWAMYSLGRFPELSLMFHIPNGGSRNKKEAANLKRQGVKAGVPDLFLPVANKGFHGLFIELKYGNNKPTEEQKEWAEKLSRQGYKSITCYGWEEAAREIEKYLK